MPNNHARLIIEGRGNWVHTHWINDKERVLIGRGTENDVDTRDSASSSKHAEIFLRGDSYYIRDIGSTNGTVVDGKKLAGELRLHNGAAIMIGRTSMSFLVDEITTSHSTILGDGSPPPRARSTRADQTLDPLDSRIKTASEQLQSGSADKDKVQFFSKVIEDLQAELKKTKAALRRQALASDFARMLYSDPTMPGVLTRGMHFIAQQIKAENGFIMQIDPQTQKWAVRARYGQIDDWFMAQAAGEAAGPPPLSLTLVKEVVGKGEPMISQSASNDPRFVTSQSIITLGINSCMGIPMKEGNATVGAIYLDRRNTETPFDQEDLNLFEALTNEMAELLYTGENTITVPAASK